MQKNLVIVESPAKAKTIEKFLGKDFKVLSSYGHICDLKKKDLSIDTDTFEPIYEIPQDKKRVVTELKEAAAKAEMVWLASDEDREGEAISWHLYDTLELKPEKTKRIVFHEITKNAILQAIENPRDIDRNLVLAQQARRVLDRIVGFKLSPVLWRKIKPSLSAGRVQSVAVRLIVEREREIKAFKPEVSYKVVAIFSYQTAEGNVVNVKADYSERFKSKEEATRFLESCVGKEFSVKDISVKPLVKTPAPPFTTSTLQQEAARKYGFTVIQTMMLAQRLYESGRITYMRTDSVNLSSLCINSSRKVIEDTMGAEYVKSRQYNVKSKGAQEAHEAIRPTYMENATIDAPAPERRIYELIWKRTIASQMADAQIEKTVVAVQADGLQGEFVITGEITKFDGFLKVYRESRDDDQETINESVSGMPAFAVGNKLQVVNIDAVERLTQRPQRYNEAALVHKMEELGIGRPSTYAPTISTIQQRGYALRDDIAGKMMKYNLIRLQDDTITEQTLSENHGSEKSKLVPTDIGLVVNDFLLDSIPDIMSYNFTAMVEKEFDGIADGEKPWDAVIREFYADFAPAVDSAMTQKNEYKVGERVLGTDPVSGKPVTVKIGRYGPIVQIGSAEDEEKPRFAQMKKGQTLENITFEQAMELFKLPRTLDEYNGQSVIIGTGKFGPYIRYGSSYVSIPKTLDPQTITFEQVLELIKEKEQTEANKLIKKFEGELDVEILNGRYGPYIASGGKNYKIPKNLNPADLTIEECKNIISELESKGTATKRRSTKRK